MPIMHVACLLAPHRILLSLQPQLNFRIPAIVQVTLQTKNCAHTAATLKSPSPGFTPDIPPIAPPNTKSCCRCSHTQIMLFGGAPDPRGDAANSELRNTNFRHSNFSNTRQLAPEICRFLIIHTKTIKINGNHTKSLMSLISERTSSHGIPSKSMDFDGFRVAPCSQVIRGMSHDSGFLSKSMDFVTFRYSKRSRGLAGFSHLSRILSNSMDFVTFPNSCCCMF